MAFGMRFRRPPLHFRAALAAVLLFSLCCCAPEHGSEVPASVPESARTEAETVAEPAVPDPPDELALYAGDGYTVWALTAERDGETVSGKLFVPEGEGPFPAVVCCHGFGGSGDNLSVFAQAFAGNEVAACVFDFVGGSVGPYGDADMTQMSVLTEAADLFAVIDRLREDPRLDRDRIFLLGHSQGGFVATYAAGERPEEIAGLFLLCPAYVIRDKCEVLAPDPEHIPETMTLWGARIGSVYVRDALSFDIADSMRAYPGPVLLFHGTADGTVPIAYSEDAAKIFPHAELIVYEGEGHGLRLPVVRDAAERALAMIRGEE